MYVNVPYALSWQAYERRARFLRPGKESTAWAHITVEMMSDEEKDGDCFIRHPPSYRSEKLSKFLQKLDERADNKNKAGHARFSRRVGSPWTKPLPAGARKWMIAEEQIGLHSSSETENCSSGSSSESELF